MPRLPRGEGDVLLERFRAYLRDHRLPVTRQRDRVAAAVLQSSDHLSVEQIRVLLRDRGEAVGLATIYRTLEILVESGLVRAHDFAQGFRRYEAMPVEAHHEHLVCLRCGGVAEFANERLERMLLLLAEEQGFRHQRHRVEVYGICPACQRRAFV